MDYLMLQSFFFWCFIINTAIYLVTAIAVLLLRKFVYAVHQKLFGFEEQSVAQSIQTYLATYKLLITVFCFTPWIAIMIII